MTRPVDWWVLDLPGDPTPGDPVRVRSLALSAGRMADDAADAHAAVRGLAGDSAVLGWLGAAGEAFRGALDDFPQMLAKLQDSYEQAADALRWWAGRLDDLQATADRALAQGRQARAEIEALQGQLASARAAASSASAASSRLSHVPAGGPPPDPAQLRAAVRNTDAAHDRVGALAGQLNSAQARLSAARSMAEQARELRQSDARTTARRLHDASDAGMAPKSRWEKFKDAAAAAWRVTVKVATVVAVVVAVVALFVGGPVVWGILLAASAVLLADSLHRYGKGEASMWEVGLNLLGVVPGGRLLTAVGKVTGLARAGARTAGAVSRPLAAAGTRLRTAATAVRNGADDLVTRVRGRSLAGDTGELVVRNADEAAAARLTAAQRQAVDESWARAAAAEPGITRRMQDVRNTVPGTRLAGLEFRLKGQESLARKVAADLHVNSDVPDVTVRELLDDVNDAVRYTFVAESADYTRRAEDVVSHLRQQGFEPVKPLKNSWGSDGYRGINSTWRDPVTGQTFEVQLHTPESLAAKTETHALYEQQRVLPPGDPRYDELGAQMNEVFRAVPRPSGAETVGPVPR